MNISNSKRVDFNRFFSPTIPFKNTEVLYSDPELLDDVFQCNLDYQETVPLAGFEKSKDWPNT